MGTTDQLTIGGPMPQQDAPLDDLERRAWRYDAQDGFVEVLAGVLFFLVARAAVDPHLTWILALAIFPLRFAHKILKERFTYPRVGYVRLRSEESARLGRGILTFLVAVVTLVALGLWLFGDVTSFEQWRRWMPALAGGFTAGGFLYLAGKSGLVRHWALAGVSAGWGVASAAWFPAPGGYPIQRWAVGLGAVCLLVGAVTFARFVRAHPLREAEPSHGAS